MARYARIVVAVAGFLQASPAAAHCFSVWRYPWPQHCGRGQAIKPPPAEDRSWYVEFVLPEPDERAEGIAKLKTLLMERNDERHSAPRSH